LIKDNCDDEDLIDLLLGELNSILDACKKGNLGRVKKILKPDNVNCQDANGRNSSPLHLAGK
jgi:tankyrase